MLPDSGSIARLGGFQRPARRLPGLDGDGSIPAANELEGVVLDDYPGDERFDDLAEVVTL
jgi:hypothetical protein